MAPRSSTFSTAVQAVLNNWTALQLAVQHQTGGPESKAIADWMVTVTEDFFYENDDVIGQEIAEWIGEILNTEFETVCEDGSLEEVGNNLCMYFNKIKKGKEEEVLLELSKLKGSGIQNCKVDSASSQMQDTEDMEDADDIEIDVLIPMSNVDINAENPKSLKNQPDEDGWVTVSKTKKR